MDEGLNYQFNGTAWIVSGVSGDMLKSTYDPANIAQQVIGATATQTVTNKTINGASNTLTVRLANDVTGALNVVNGGTGQTTYTNGQLLIGNTTGGTLAKATLTAGAGIAITNGAGTVAVAAANGILPQLCNGRLTFTSGVAVTTTDVTAATTLYFTPYGGNGLALYSGTAWALIAFTQLSIAVPSTTSTMYDVFVYNNAGVATLELAAWTSDTVRATALVIQDGVYVKSGATTRRYLGSMRTTGVSGQSEDSQLKRYLWNYNNRVARTLSVTESASSWTYSILTIRQTNANPANQLDVVIGVAEDAVSISSYSLTASSVTAAVYSGIGVDSTTSFKRMVVTGVIGAQAVQGTTLYYDLPGIGRHVFTWLEEGAGGGTQTWFGSGNGVGLIGTLWG